MSLPEPRHLARLPPAVLPWIYLAFAHLALIWALSMVVAYPELLAGYFYQPRVVGLVHAITLGWITCTILGALYLVGPIALRVAFVATRTDAIACGAVLTGALGMISHFWIDSYSGMVWSAGTLLAGIAIVGFRTLPALAAAPVPAAVRIGISLAFANLLLAGVLGSSIGLEKIGQLTVPGPVLAGVWAHAHLAGLGWATMMVMGVGYRLLPMLIPAAMPRGRSLMASVLLLQVGVLGLAAGMILEQRWSIVFALTSVAGVTVFAVRMATRFREIKPSPKNLPRPDLALGHNILAVAYLIASIPLGLALATLPTSPTTLRLAAVYGVLALIGFLTQLIVGVGGRLIPLNAWMQSYVRSGFVEPDFTQYVIGDRRVQATALLGWAVGVPLLAAGVMAESEAMIRAAASMLLLAVLLEAVQRVRAWRVCQMRFTSQEEPIDRTESRPDS